MHTGKNLVNKLKTKKEKNRCTNSSLYLCARPSPWVVPFMLCCLVNLQPHYTWPISAGMCVVRSEQATQQKHMPFHGPSFSVCLTLIFQFYLFVSSDLVYSLFTTELSFTALCFCSQAHDLKCVFLCV